MLKPELGKVAVGDRLLVIPASYGRGALDPVEVVATKAGRVWVELAATDDVRSFARTWRMRLDTQNINSGYSSQDRFVTREQYAWEQRESAVHQYLIDIGIRPDRDSPWDSSDQRLILANLLRAHDGLDPL